MTRTRLEKIVALAVLLASLSAIVGGVGAIGALAVDDAETSAASRQPSATEAGPAERVADRAAVAMKKITVRGVCVDQHSTPLFEVRVRIFRYPSRIDAPVLIADLRTDTKGEFIARDIETVVDRSPLGGMGDLFVAATADRRVSAIKRAGRARGGPRAARRSLWSRQAAHWGRGDFDEGESRRHLSTAGGTGHKLHLFDDRRKL